MTQHDSYYKQLPAWARFVFYGMHGLLVEILFTALFDFILHPHGNSSLKGHSSIFSIFIYGTCSFFTERLYVFLHQKHGVTRKLRLPLYVCIAYAWEFCWGLVLRQFDACSWDYSHYPYNFMGLITLEYAPGWLILGVWQDVLADFLLSLNIRIKSPQNQKID